MIVVPRPVGFTVAKGLCIKYRSERTFPKQFRQGTSTESTALC